MEIMNFMRNPSKRIRLDLPNNLDTNVANDDLWGQDDITAEEFDMLEIQATQESSKLDTFRQPLPKTSKDETSVQIAANKQHQYELEGKVKILSDTLEAMKNELLEEKLKREKFVSELEQEFKEKQKLLQKEVDKAQSSLQFKDQEIKSVYTKLNILETKLRETNIKDVSHKSPNKFLNRFNFKTGVSIEASTSRQCHQPLLRRKYRHKLTINTSQEKTQGCDIVSSVLCNKLTSPIVLQSNLPPSQTETDVSDQNTHLSALSIAKIYSEEETVEIFHYSYSVLKNYLTYLQNFSTKITSNTPTSPARRKDLLLNRAKVISCLKDLCLIVSCPQFSSIIKNWSSQEENKDTNKKFSSLNTGAENLPSYSNFICDKECQQKENIISLLKLLFILSNPNTYPSGYLKSQEIEFSLSVLVSWSYVDFKSLLDVFDERLTISHICKCYNITSSTMVLKLLLNLCFEKEYVCKLIHTDSCHLCAIATLLHRKISAVPYECINLMLLVVDFLSSVFLTHTFTEMKLETSQCSEKIIQSVLLSLFKYYQVKEKSPEITVVLQKGFILLHSFSKFILNFKERRREVEDLYILLVTEMLTLSKDDDSFKDFYEIARELWDFQEDASEFDMDDSPDDTMQTESSINQSES